MCSKYNFSWTGLTDVISSSMHTLYGVNSDIISVQASFSKSLQNTKFQNARVSLSCILCAAHPLQLSIRYAMKCTSALPIKIVIFQTSVYVGWNINSSSVSVVHILLNAQNRHEQLNKLLLVWPSRWHHGSIECFIHKESCTGDRQVSKQTKPHEPHS